MELLSSLFQLCVDVMYFLADLTKTSYKEINTIVFLIIQPALVVLFFLLWIHEKKKHLHLKLIHNKGTGSNHS